jgi:hypothetical protein
MFHGDIITSLEIRITLARVKSNGGLRRDMLPPVSNARQRVPPELANARAIPLRAGDTSFWNLPVAGCWL